MRFSKFKFFLTITSIVSISFILFYCSENIQFYFINLKESPLKAAFFYFLFTVLSSLTTFPLGVFVKLLSGWLFGFVNGSLLCYVSMLVGAVLAFLISNKFLKMYFENKLKKYTGLIDKINSENSLLFVIKFRFFPFIPFSVLNYLFGITNISLSHFLLGTLVGILPATLFYGYIGSKMSDLLNANPNGTSMIYFTLFLFLSFLFVHFLSRLLNLKKMINQVIPVMKKTLDSSSKNSWDEQALPSYLNKNFFVRFTFWNRIVNSFKVAPRGETVLDFGCGTGAMLPFLTKGYQQIFCYDLNSSAIEINKIIAKNNGWSNVEYLQFENNIFPIESNSIDTIFALDVLEHVDDLPRICNEFKRILRADGKLIVCSPTENWIYKFVRRFGGPGYQGEFHLRAAKEVEHDLSVCFRYISLVKRVYPILTFFRIVEVKK